jgi:hypothetical protein
MLIIAGSAYAFFFEPNIPLITLPKPPDLDVDLTSSLPNESFLKFLDINEPLLFLALLLLLLKLALSFISWLPM